MNETRWPGAGAAVFLGGVLKLRDTGGWSHLLPTVFEEVCGGGGGDDDQKCHTGPGGDVRERAGLSVSESGTRCGAEWRGEADRLRV